MEHENINLSLLKTGTDYEGEKNENNNFTYISSGIGPKYGCR